MSRHPSNSDRIARAAAEAEATAAEKAEKKAKAPKAKSPRKSAGSTRMKIVWAVGRLGFEPVKLYPYPQKAEAEADASTRGEGYAVSALRVPMD